MDDMLVQSSNGVTVTRKGRSVAALHEYLRSSLGSVNAASKVLSDLHTARGVGQIFVQEANATLYYYAGNKLYHTFSRGGRLIVIMARAGLSLTSQRKEVIKKRFLLVDDQVDDHLAKHFEHLLQLSGSKNFGKMTQQFINGEFKIHMRDLKTPFIEIARDHENTPLVVPLHLVSELAAVNVLPHTAIEYSGQHIILATNEDYTVRVLYVSHLLEDGLFTQHG